MSVKTYTLEEIGTIIAPIARKYSIQAVYVFGSYARNEETEKSDIDFLIERTGSSIKGMFDMGNLFEDLQMCFSSKIDLITLETLEQKRTKERSKMFVETVNREKVKIYEQ